MSVDGRAKGEAPEAGPTGRGEGAQGAAPTSDNAVRDDREKLARLCENPKATVVSRSHLRPSRWFPLTVDRPGYEAFNLPFENVSAFEFCAEQLRAGHPMERITLEKPPGCFGYVMRFPHSGGRELYVKLEISPDGNFVFGRSFHYSDKVPGEQ